MPKPKPKPKHNLSKKLVSIFFPCGLVVFMLFTAPSCSSPDAKVNAVEHSQDSGALVNFLDTHPDIARQLMKQTIAIYFIVPDKPQVAIKSSGIIVDNKTLLTAAHVLDQLLSVSNGKVKSL